MNTAPKDKTPAQMMLDPVEWDTVRSECGQARTTYFAEWSPSQPWVTFQHGTAGRHFPTLGAAVEFLRSKGFRFDL